MSEYEVAQETTETPYIPEAGGEDTEAAAAEEKTLDELVLEEAAEQAGEPELEQDDAEPEDEAEAGEPEEDAAPEAEDKAGEKPFTPQVDFAGIRLTAERFAKKGMREAQLKSEGVDGNIAEYIATVEQVNQQYREVTETLTSEAGVLAETAGILGVPTADFAAQMKTWAIDAAANDRSKEYTERGYEAEIAKEMALKDIKVEIAEKAAQQKQAVQAVDEAFMAEVRKLYAAHPETQTMAKMPDEVIAAWQGGEDMVAAYRGHLLTQAEAAKKAAEGARKAAAKSTGGATSRKNDDNMDVGAIFMANYGQ